MSGEHGPECLQKCLKRRFNRQHAILDAQMFGLRLGFAQADIGGIARRQHHRRDLVGAKRIDRQRQRQRRIDAAGQPKQHAGKVIFVDIVANPAHQSCVHARLARTILLDRPSVRGEAARAAIVVGDQQRIDESRRTRSDATIGLNK